MPVLIARRLLQPGDFPTWEERFKARSGARKDAGCQGVQYYRSLENEDEVVIIFEWHNLEQGKAFLDAMLKQFPEVDNTSTKGRAMNDYIFAEEMPRLAS